MKEITFTDPHRKKHFEFFNKFSQPHFNICGNVDITTLVEYIKKRSLSFTPTMVYLTSKIANDIPVFRQRIRGKKIIQHELVHPSFAITPKNSDVFSFCPVAFQYDFHSFYSEAISAIEHFQDNPTVEDDKERDDYLFLSIIPWISFTGFTHAMNNIEPDSIPRIVWGKYFKSEKKILMPLSIQAHHALVDGRQVGLYFEQFEKATRAFNTEVT
jgi:chloramphenicol O-acetyltransferase type A